MRKVVAAALVAAVQAAALGAPLAHAHLDDHATDHHGGRVVHAHWSGHAHDAQAAALPVAAADEDERPTYLNAYVAVEPPPFHAPGIAHDAVPLPVPHERAAQRGVEVAHGPDPPWVAARSSRAPPARLP